MSNYVENNLYENEWIVESARRDKWGLIGWWIFGVLCFWLLLIPTILAIKHTIVYCHTELTLTNKRIVYKSGVFHTRAFDAPLDKIYNVYLDAGFWGRIFNSRKIRIDTASGVLVEKIADGEEFKSLILGQIDQFHEARLALQASWTGYATASAIAPQHQAKPKAKRRNLEYDI